jgi:hypothetical protein
VSIDPVGLRWADYVVLDETMAALDAVKRELPPITEVARDTVEDFMRGVEDNAYSWTWKVEDPTRLAQVAEEVRRWAEDRYGPLADVPRESLEAVWVAYDLPV